MKNRQAIVALLVKDALNKIRVYKAGKSKYGGKHNELE